MRRLIVGALLSVLVTPAVFAAGEGSAKDGKEAFRQHCVACHAADGSGNQAMAKAAKLTIPDLGSKEVQAESDADLKKVITEGKGKMKPVKDLSGKDVANLVAFIRTLAKK
jgi:mono/diheme cytochrome c family protein